MTSFMNGNILLIKMDSRLDTSNAAETEKFIMNEIFLPDFTENDMELLRGVCEVLGHVRMMIVAVTSAALNALTPELRRKGLFGLKGVLKNIYFDRAEKVLEDVKYITGKF